jgi:hypothetical protein
MSFLMPRRLLDKSGKISGKAVDSAEQHDQSTILRRRAVGSGSG